MNRNRHTFSKTELPAFKEISRYKWRNGFACRLCGGTKYYEGTAPYSRKCQNIKCKKEESATANTVFERLRIPIDAGLSLVKILSRQQSYMTIEELTDKLYKRTSFKIKPKAIWELMYKVYDRMEVHGVIFDKDVLVVVDGEFALLTGIINGIKCFHACRSKEIHGSLINIKLNPTANYTVCKSNGMYLRGKGRDTLEMYDWSEMVKRFDNIFHLGKGNNESRIAALLKLYSFIMNGGNYKNLMVNLTNGYSRNKDLLF